MARSRFAFSTASRYSGILRKGGLARSDVVYGKRTRVAVGSTPYQTRQERWYNRTQGPVSFIRLDPKTGGFVLSKSFRRSKTFLERYASQKRAFERSFLNKMLKKFGLIKGNKKASKGKINNFLKQLNKPTKLQKFFSNFGRPSPKAVSIVKALKFFDLGGRGRNFSSLLAGQRFGSQAKNLKITPNVLRTLERSGLVTGISKRFGTGYEGQPGINKSFLRRYSNAVSSSRRENSYNNYKKSTIRDIFSGDSKRVRSGVTKISESVSKRSSKRIASARLKPNTRSRNLASVRAARKSSKGVNKRGVASVRAARTKKNLSKKSKKLKNVKTSKGSVKKSNIKIKNRYRTKDKGKSKTGTKINTKSKDKVKTVKAGTKRKNKISSKGSSVKNKNKSVKNSTTKKGKSLVKGGAAVKSKLSGKAKIKDKVVKNTKGGSSKGLKSDKKLKSKDEVIKGKVKKPPAKMTSRKISAKDSDKKFVGKSVKKGVKKSQKDKVVKTPGKKASKAAPKKSPGKRGRKKDPNAIRNKRVFGNKFAYSGFRRAIAAVKGWAKRRFKSMRKKAGGFLGRGFKGI